MDRFRSLVAQGQARWERIPERQRIPYAAIFALTVAAMVMLTAWATRPRWVPLDEQPTDPQSAKDLKDAIESSGYELRVEPRTGRYLVHERDKPRIQAEQGVIMQSDANPGLELVDQARMGGTRAQEHARFVRGLQGEIEQLLNSYKSVAGSKVLISMQRDALFREDRVEPSASVFLKLKPGTELTVSEGERMARQVAGAVVGLRPERVHILDERMRTLHAAADDGDSPDNGLAGMQREWERYYQRKVETLLFEMLGHGRASVRIAVQLDHAQRSTYARDIDPEKVVTIQSNSREQSSNRGAARGQVGTAANVDAPPDAETGTLNSMSSETLDIDVPETRKTDVQAPGAVLAISAGIAVDGHRVTATAAEGEATDAAPATGAAVYKPRTEQEIAALTELVRNALGPAAKTVTVVNHEFEPLDLAPAEAGLLTSFTASDITTLARYALLLMLALAAYILVLRPMVKAITVPLEDKNETVDAVAMDTPSQLVDGDPPFDVHAWIARFSADSQEVSRDDVARLVLANVDRSVVTLQGWLLEEGPA